MRLIDTASFTLHEFFQRRIPRYATLSHRWRNEEITFNEFQDTSQQVLENREGYIKIKDFCEIARSQHYGYAWVDTCCIDKKSSSELSEAINSMFKWYEKSGLCCVFLSDVYDKNDSKQFQESEWFKRGWTLQELVAPKGQFQFFTRDWTLIGTRRSLCDDISSVTNIPGKDVLAAFRETTRAEDMAYSLLGLFGVNMTLLYGEGGNAAFKRLQLGIISIYNDESIFAWSGAGRLWEGSVLAMHPKAFADGGMVVLSSPLAETRSYSVTNLGLKIKMHVLEHPLERSVKAHSSYANLISALVGLDPSEVEGIPSVRLILAPIHGRRDGKPLCLHLALQGGSNPSLSRLDVQVAPHDVQLSDFDLRKVVLKIIPTRNEHHLVLDSGASISSCQSLKVLQSELKAKIEHRLLSDKAPEGEQFLYDEKTKNYLIDPRDCSVLHFEAFFLVSNGTRDCVQGE